MIAKKESNGYGNLSTGYKVALRRRGAITGSNPTDRSKLGTKRHILTDKQGIPLSAVISSANSHDVKAVIDVIDNAIVIKQPMSFLSVIKKKKVSAAAAASMP